MSDLLGENKNIINLHNIFIHIKFYQHVETFQRILNLPR